MKNKQERKEGKRETKEQRIKIKDKKKCRNIRNSV